MHELLSEILEVRFAVTQNASSALTIDPIYYIKSIYCTPKLTLTAFLIPFTTVPLLQSPLSQRGTTFALFVEKVNSDETPLPLSPFKRRIDSPAQLSGVWLPLQATGVD